MIFAREVLIEKQFADISLRPVEDGRNQGQQAARACFYWSFS